jgi:hypothetical protein
MQTYLDCPMSAKYFIIQIRQGSIEIISKTLRNRRSKKKLRTTSADLCWLAMF